MANTQLLPYSEFTGGLNLRADPFMLADNESPDMKNVTVDPRGGFAMRESWKDWQQLTGATPWDPRNLWSHTNGQGLEALFVVNGTDLWVREQGDSFVNEGGTFEAAPHGADFATWKNEVYIAAGSGQPGYRWTSAGGAVAMTDASTDWANDPLTPKSNQMPKAEFVANHGGYLWVGNTREGGVDYEQRIRFSFPNDPDSWGQLDYIDIPEGEGPITALVPYRDQLLVFFPNSIYAIFGYDLNSFVKSEVSKNLGAVNRQAVDKAEQGVYFVSWPEGVHRIDGQSVDEVSRSLRPALEGFNFGADMSKQWLSWADQYLYWSAPYDTGGAPSEAVTTFVFDPSLESWTLMQASDGGGLGKVALSTEKAGPVGVSRASPWVLDLTGGKDATDLIGGVEYDIDAYYKTRWMTAGPALSTIKKRWKRPDLVVKKADTPYEMTIYVYHEYDTVNAKRTKTFTVGTEGGGGLWEADPEWDGTDASLATPEPGAQIWSETPDPGQAGWGFSPEGATTERSSSLGSAAAVQLLVTAEPGRYFGVNKIIFKYVLRRIR